jgi:Fur family transcriptional regulator, ferric uptake regulator
VLSVFSVLNLIRTRCEFALSFALYRGSFSHFVNPPLHNHRAPLGELNLESLLELLRSHGMRITRTRKQVLSSLLKAKGPLSLDEIQRWSTASGCAPDYATVFRIVSVLIELGVAQKVNLNRSCSYFELIDPQQHYDHIVCTECGKVTLMVDACPVERLERTIEKRYGYSELRHSLEFFGKCQECA